MDDLNFDKNVFRKDAKQIVDTLFDAELFKDKISRDDMKSLEDMIFEIMNGRYNSEIKIRQLFKRIKNKENEK